MSTTLWQVCPDTTMTENIAAAYDDKTLNINEDIDSTKYFSKSFIHKKLFLGSSRNLWSNIWNNLQWWNLSAETADFDSLHIYQYNCTVQTQTAASDTDVVFSYYIAAFGKSFQIFRQV